MHLHLGGHLSWYDPAKRSRLEISLPQPVLLNDLIVTLGLPIAEIAIFVVNGQGASPTETLILDSDHVELFPPVGGG